ncbi:peptidylprolyl isomerase [Burkholderiaceae bacterium DAT-1]|nr:peptidylprolyl isomerase [Burkholderiaceae bacterium DAT-1]
MSQWLMHTVLAASFAAMAAAATPPAQQSDAPPVIATINSEPIYRLTLNVHSAMARLNGDSSSRQSILDTLITQRLLASVAESRFGQLGLHPENRVAFDPDVALDDRMAGQLRTVYANELATSINQLPNGVLDSLITELRQPDATELDRVFGKRSRLILDYTLNDAQLKEAGKVLVLRTTLAAAPAITLQDIYRRQNVQGRVSLFNRDQRFIRQQAQLYLANLYVHQWARQQFGEAQVADLRRSLAEQDTLQQVRSLHGLSMDTDSVSALLNQLAETVSQKEILAYYQAHRSDFHRIESVTARHIRVDSEALAQRLFKAASSGEDFSALARLHSTAPDASTGGHLGVIPHRATLTWLEELAFMQTPGKVSTPIRSPAGPQEKAYWEIVLVDARRDGYQNPASESVRYQASRAIAQQKAARQLAELQAKLRRDASIRILSTADIQADARPVTHAGPRS